MTGVGWWSRRRTVVALVAACAVVGIGGSVAVVTLHRGSGSAPSTVAARPTGPVCVHRQIQEIRIGASTAFAEPHGTPIDYYKNPLLPARDAQGDLITMAGRSTEIVRRDGTVVLRNAAVQLFGDFDGDGRTDVVAEDYEGGDRVAYIVPGTVAVGTHDPAAVGIRLPQVKSAESPVFTDWTTVGDQNHDGADDLMRNNRLYSGRQMMDARPGTALAALPPPFETSSQTIVGILQLVPNATPTLVRADWARAQLVVDDRRLDRLTFDLAGIDETGLGGPIVNGARASAWLVNRHRIVELRYGDREGWTAWRWDLDAPCVVNDAGA